MPRLRTIGYWRSDSHPEYPNPEDFVDTTWDKRERHLVEWHLSRAFAPNVWMGYSSCRICGRENGAMDFTDGVYLWPEGLVHYVKDHNVRLPQDFVDHVHLQLDQFESIEEDHTRWLNTTRAT